MSEELKRNFMQQLLEKMNPNLVPVSRSYVVRAKPPYIENENIEGDNISEEPNWNGSIQLSLFLLVGESKELSPELFEGLPVIDFIGHTGMQAYYKETRSCPEDLSPVEHKSLLTEKFGSLLENIQKANAAAARAFAYVKAELTKKGVDIKFEKDLSHFDYDITTLTPAYFVLNHGDSYEITADTLSIIDTYEAWLVENILKHLDLPPIWPKIVS